MEMNNTILYILYTIVLLVSGFGQVG